MKLLTLKLSNFKGIRSFVLDAKGGSAQVFGRNATGKSTIFDSVTWLLFDKDSQNKKDFAIKTLDAAGQPLSGLEHEVEAVFEIGGKKLTLRKVYTEKWTQKRGAAKKEFTGHETSYYIDGVPVKKNEYVAKIAEIADEDTFKLLTNPKYFNEQLHWEKRRKILLEVCGDITDADVIASSEKLAKLPGILGDRKLDDHKKVIASRRTEISKEFDKIPVRISEVQKGLPDADTIDPAAVKAKIADLRTKRQEKQAELSRVQSGGEIAEKVRRVREIESELLDIKNKHRASIDEKVKEKRDDLNLLSSSTGDLRRSISSTKSDIANNADTVAQLENKAVTLRREWHEVNERAFSFEQDGNCYACGQALPKDKVTEAYEKAVAKFNLDKANELKEINCKGKKIKAEIERLTAENNELAKELLSAEKELGESEAAESKLRTGISNLLLNAGDPTETEAYKAKLKEKEETESLLEDLRTGGRELATMVQDEIDTLDEELQGLEKDLAAVDAGKKAQERIAELKAQEKMLAAELEKLEQELHLTEEFIRVKVAMLEGKINSRFKLARFKMFDVQVNGGVAECCETIYSGVPYSAGLNNGHQIIVGCDIINTLAEHYDFAPMIFVDNAEAVTEVIETRGQQISLVVSAKDKKLRVETEGQESLFPENLEKEAV